MGKLGKLIFLHELLYSGDINGINIEYLYIDNTHRRVSKKKVGLLGLPFSLSFFGGLLNA